MTTYAFIDGQNLYSGVQSLGWQLDLGEFRTHLRQKHGVDRAFYFVGYMQRNEGLYAALRRTRYELVFKKVVEGAKHDPKGNVDAHLVLFAALELPRYDRALLVSGDGDYYPLVDHLVSVGKLHGVMAPNRRYCSTLLTTAAGNRMYYVEDVRSLVERRPGR